MTEDEAKTKWCFHFIASHTNPRQREWADGDGCEVPTGPFLHNCVGSACMAWQTRHQWLDNAQEEPGWVSYAPYGFTPGPGQEREDGFCGLIGSPA